MKELFKSSLTEPIDNCQKCGEPTHEDINPDRNNPEQTLRISRRCLCDREEEKRKMKMKTRRMEEEKRRTETEAQAEIDNHFKKFRKFSSGNIRFQTSTFENWQHHPDNEKYYKFGINYCEEWEKMREDGLGFLFFGDPGTGKSFLAASIANRLSTAGIPVVFSSFTNILRILREGYSAGDSGMTDHDVSEALNQAELLILDDLGVEYKTKWSYEKLYTIIDDGYNMRKPLIITTNLDIRMFRQYLKVIDDKLNLTDEKERLFNRIYEMCRFFPILPMEGHNWRIAQGLKNNKEVIPKKPELF